MPMVRVQRPKIEYTQKIVEPYQESIGASFGETGKVMTEVGLKQYGNFVADKTTTEITDHSPGYLPF